jgi:hypothetical protein
MVNEVFKIQERRLKVIWHSYTGSAGVERAAVPAQPAVPVRQRRQCRPDRQCRFGRGGSAGKHEVPPDLL